MTRRGRARPLRTTGACRKPELFATEPNELWSWDTTKLLGPEKWTYYYLLCDPRHL